MNLEQKIDGVFWGYYHSMVIREHDNSNRYTNKWNQTKDVPVRKIPGETTEIFEGRLFELDCTKICHFHMRSDDDVLCRMQYRFETLNGEDAKSLFGGIKIALERKYGESAPGCIENLPDINYGDIKRWITHENPADIDGRTVIELCLSLSSDDDYQQRSNSGDVWIMMWENGNGGTDERYRMKYYHDKKKREALVQQAMQML